MAHRRILLEDEPICSSKSENKLIELSAAPSPEPTPEYRALESMVIGSDPAGPGGWTQPPWATPNVVAQVTSIPPFRPPQTNNVTVTVNSFRRYGAQQAPTAVPPTAATEWSLINPHASIVPQEMTFNDLFERLGMNHLRDMVIPCRRCNYTGAFDANFITENIQCLGCGKIWSFTEFKRAYS